MNAQSTFHPLKLSVIMSIDSLLHCNCSDCSVLNTVTWTIRIIIGILQMMKQRLSLLLRITHPICETIPGTFCSVRLSIKRTFSLTEPWVDNFILTSSPTHLPGEHYLSRVSSYFLFVYGVSYSQTQFSADLKCHLSPDFDSCFSQILPCEYDSAWPASVFHFKLG